MWSLLKNIFDEAPRRVHASKNMTGSLRVVIYLIEFAVDPVHQNFLLLELFSGLLGDSDRVVHLEDAAVELADLFLALFNGGGFLL